MNTIEQAREVSSKLRNADQHIGTVNLVNTLFGLTNKGTDTINALIAELAEWKEEAISAQGRFKQAEERLASIKQQEPVAYIHEDQLQYLRTVRGDESAQVRYTNGFTNWLPDYVKAEFLPLYLAAGAQEGCKYPTCHSVDYQNELAEDLVAGRIAVPPGYQLVPVEVLDLYQFMHVAFTPIGEKQQAMQVKLNEARKAMLAAAPVQAGAQPKSLAKLYKDEAQGIEIERLKMQIEARERKPVAWKFRFNNGKVCTVYTEAQLRQYGADEYSRGIEDAAMVCKAYAPIGLDTVLTTVEIAIKKLGEKS